MNYLHYDLIKKQKHTWRLITINHQNHNKESQKNKHLNFKELMTIEIRLKDGFSAYKISK